MSEHRARRAVARVLALLAFGVAGLPAPAGADEIPVGAADRAGLTVTIYNDGLALIGDRREVTLAPGPNRLAFLDVSAALQPETARLRVADAVVIEQGLAFDPLTRTRLLQDAVGKTVRVVRTHPETGAETTEDATVLSVAEGVVLRIGDRIETDPPGRIVFADVPAGLRARPTLVATVEAAAAGRRAVELDYLTGGLSWRADYVAELDAAEERLDLDGWATLNNASGADYRDAELRLVAGAVHRATPGIAMRQDVMTMQAEAAPAMAESAPSEYHLYRLDRPVTIADNETKQVALLSGAGVPVAREYRFVNLGRDVMGEERPVNATVRLAFENTKAGGLGLALPAGVIRFYRRDEAGRALFLGEDAIAHTAEGARVELTLGQAFDVTALARQTAFERPSERLIEVAFEIVLENAKPTPVTATVVEEMAGEWRVLEESHKHERTAAQRAEWRVPVPAEGRAVLTYRVRIES